VRKFVAPTDVQRLVAERALGRPWLPAGGTVSNGKVRASQKSIVFGVEVNQETTFGVLANQELFHEAPSKSDDLYLLVEAGQGNTVKDVGITT
jgi:hypothetical protein